MEASVRLLFSLTSNRRLIRTSTRSIRLSLTPSSPLFRHPNNNPDPNPNPSGAADPPLPLRRRSISFAVLSQTAPFSSHAPPNRLDPLVSSPSAGGLRRPDRAADGGGMETRFSGESGATWTVVLLGWLGAEHKHLSRYAGIYEARGIRSVRFVVPVSDLLRLDLGRRVEARIADLARDLVSWCSETEKDGREPRLIFHAFSNTGWLTYGVILENLQSRSDIVEKIKGCVVDSGPIPEISPQVWAAGFCAALLKKRSSLTLPSVASVKEGRVDGNYSVSNFQDVSPSLKEIIVFSIFEKIFSIVLNFPDVNQRLSRIIFVLSKSQPMCPQLYLYSSADKVIPVHSIERFIEDQRALGREVVAHDFGSSPHVDHFRSSPDIYTAKINDFLEYCSRGVSRMM